MSLHLYKCVTQFVAVFLVNYVKRTKIS